MSRQTASVQRRGRREMVMWVVSASGIVQIIQNDGDGKKRITVFIPQVPGIPSFSVKVVAADVLDPRKRPELFGADGSLSFLVLHDPFDDEARVAQDRGTLI